MLHTVAHSTDNALHSTVDDLMALAVFERSGEAVCESASCHRSAVYASFQGSDQHKSYKIL